jgi:hypothetical protein
LIDPSHFKSPPIRRLAEYWIAKASPGHLPGRQDIKPEDLRADLPFVYLIDVASHPLSFRFRLVGTRVSEWTGRDFTGAAVNEIDYGPQWQRIFNDYKAVVESKAAVRAEVYGPWVAKEFRYYERFLAPLARDGSTVDMLFGALHIITPPR